LSPEAAGLHPVGRGRVLFEPQSPAALAALPTGSATVFGLLQQGAAAVHLPLTEKTSLILRRGPYVIAAGLSPLLDSGPKSAPVVVRGDLINLFDADLNESKEVAITPGTRTLLLDVNYFRPSERRILAASAKISNVHAAAHSFRFQAEGIDQTNAVVRILSTVPAKEVRVDGELLDPGQYTHSGRTLLLRFTNLARPQTIELRF
jgi:hypothetical protein